MLRALKYSALILGILLGVTFEPTAEAAKKGRRPHKKNHHSKSVHKKHGYVLPMKKAKVHKMPEDGVGRQNASTED